VGLWKFTGPVGRLIHSAGEAWMGDHVELDEEQKEYLSNRGYQFEEATEQEASENRAGQRFPSPPEAAPTAVTAPAAESAGATASPASNPQGQQKQADVQAEAGQEAKAQQSQPKAPSSGGSPAQ
jgi:hypothetical protein